ncbi:DUF1850 domain-containing protein [Paenibacillus chungangensis]|uniref:DUF1850 domain-containing protein n=1 Tax=Paenibacillus chungangensis TaxID=696535 RepID=A0ABW3HQX3_9BACL
MRPLWLGKKEGALLRGNALSDYSQHMVAAAARRTKLLWAGVIGIALVAILWWLLLPVSAYHLQIVRADSGKVLWSDNVQPGEVFLVRYVHSVELSPVLEFFMVGDDGEIVATESRTRSFGAGLPHEKKGITELAGGYYVMRGLHEPVGELHVQPSYLHSHTLQFKGVTVHLNESPYAREHLIVRAQQPPRWQALLGGG